MRRYEAAVLVAAGLAFVVAGAAWLFGPYGLLGAGVLLLAAVLFVFDVEG